MLRKRIITGNIFMFALLVEVQPKTRISLNI